MRFFAILSLIGLICIVLGPTVFYIGYCEKDNKRCMGISLWLLFIGFFLLGVGLGEVFFE